MIFGLLVCSKLAIGTEAGFVDAANFHFHLKAASPCISKGVDSLASNPGDAYNAPPQSRTSGSGRKRGQEPFVQSTRRAVPAKGS